MFDCNFLKPIQSIDWPRKLKCVCLTVICWQPIENTDCPSVHLTVILYAVVWCCMMLYDVVWCFMMLFDVVWFCVMVCDVVWYYMMLYDVVRFCMMLNDFVWCCMMLYDVVSCCMMLYDALFFVLYAMCYVEDNQSKTSLMNCKIKTQTKPWISM